MTAGTMASSDQLQRGLALHRAGDLAGAAGQFAAHVHAVPTDAEGWFLLGSVQLGQGRIAQGIEALTRAAALRPGHAETQGNLGSAYTTLGRHAEAATAYREAVRLSPDFQEAWSNLGSALARLGRPEEALSALDRARRLAPNHAPTHNRIGIALAALGKTREAVAHYREAVRLQPDLTFALNNLGGVLSDLGELEEAEQVLRRSLALSPNNARALNNLGSVVGYQGRPEEAEECFAAAVRAEPSLADAHTNWAFSLLRRGDYARGLPEYEWRLRMKGSAVDLPQPAWDGSPLNGRPLVMHAEQGAGDNFQFVRYGAVARRRGGPVYFRCPAGLHPLLSRTPGLDRLLAEGDAWPTDAVHAPLLSLPCLVGTRLETIPAEVPYLFPSPPLVEKWRRELAALPGLKVGVAWQGNPKYRDDRWRSFPLRCLEPLAHVPGVTLLSLQKGYGVEQLPALGGAFPIRDVGSRLDEQTPPFEETAALVSLLDLVVTCDSVLGHLAGGLGTPAWMALCRLNEWRWLLNRDDSPWYPRTRLFRQERMGDWDSVFRQMADALRQRQGPSFRVPSSSATPPGASTMPTTADPLTLGLQYHQAGNLRQAASCYEQCLRQAPERAEAWYLLGTAYLGMEETPRALEALHKSIELRPDYAEALSNLGTGYARKGDYLEAVKQFRASLRVQPDYVDAMSNLGAALAKLGEVEEAISHYERALRLRPDHAETHNNLGSSLTRRHRHNEALPHFREAVRLRPRYAEAHSNLALSLTRLNRPEEALPCAAEAIRLRPNYVDAYLNLGLAHARLKHYEESEKAYRRALELRPEHAETYAGLGSLFSEQGRFDDAIACFHQALAIKPEHAETHNGLGGVLLLLGRTEEGVVHLRAALRAKPDLPDAHFNMAFPLLMAGEYEEGWEKYEYRWKCKDFSPRPYTQPLWDGSSPEGKTLFLYHEQGLGDTIQFIRYAALVKRAGARVVVECQPALRGLLAGHPSMDVLIVTGDTPPAFDAHAPLMSLPRLCRTTLDTVPAEVPYLSADPALVDQWRRELARLPGYKVGIAWQGNKGYSSDRSRSFPLEYFAPVAAVPGVTLVSLQKGYGAEQIEALNGRFTVHDLGKRLDEASGPFQDTVAVLRCLDLVITCDSVLGHLAGALGVPVWITQSEPPEWRWLQKREDSPWYPTVRLFRQPERGDWKSVFERLATALRERVDAAPSTRVLADVAELERRLMACTEDGDLLEAARALRTALRTRQVGGTE